MKNFALIGSAGYIAPRHMQAIKETGNNLLVALDKSDSVGIIDRYFPDADFFTEFERFDRHIYKLHKKEQKIDYCSICSPNYLHDSHIRFALRSGADAICEKPLVLNPWNLEQLKLLEKDTGKKIYNILQLRLHPSIIQLKDKVQKELQQNPNKVYNIDLTYLTSRGKWYYISWKGNEEKSGGLASNIGVHFYDMLTWIFGDVKENHVNLRTQDVCSGNLVLKHANIRWFLSINYNYIPSQIKEAGKRTYRSIMIDDAELEFSDGFTDLHTSSYRRILDKDGFGLEDCEPSIRIVSQIRHEHAIGLKGEYHPLCLQVNSI